MHLARHRWGQRYRDLPAAYWWLWSAILVLWVGRFVVPFMSLFLTKELGLTTAQAGLVVSGFGLGGIASTMTGGVLADRIGRLRTVVGSLLLSAAVTAAIATSSGVAVIAPLLIALGLVSGAAYPALSAMLLDVVAPAQRPLAISLEYWAMNLGYAIGPILAGFLADRSFEWLFYGEAAAILATVVMIVTRVGETRRTPAAPEEHEEHEEQASLGTVLRDRRFMLFVGLYAVYAIVYLQSTITLPLAMTADGFSAQQFGWLLTINGALLCLLQIPTASFLARWSRSRVLVAAVVLTGAGFGLQALAGHWSVYALAAVIWTLGEMGTMPTAKSIAVDMSTAAARGRYQGTYALSFSVATFIAPLVGGATYQATGATWLWIACFAVCAAVATGFALTAGTHRVRHAQPVEA